MRVVILATVLLATSSLYPSLAQEASKPPIVAPKRLPASLTKIPSNSGSNVPSVADPRMTIVKWAATGGCAAATASVWAEKTVTRVRNGEDTVTVIIHRESDKDRDRYSDRDNRGGRDRADRGRDDSDYYDEDRPRRRVKICIEYENGDEYCRYKGR